MKIPSLCLAACVAFAFSPARAASPIDFSPLTKLIQETKKLTGQPSGTAIAVIKDGKIIHQSYFGFADISAQLPVTPDTPFYIASS